MSDGQKAGVIFWDFDGTLAERPGMWGGAMLKSLLEHEPTTPITVDDIRPHLSTGFPWHTPEIPHPELNTPELWWEHLEGILTRAYEAVGISTEIARMLSRRAHYNYIDPRGFNVFADVEPVLTHLTAQGWRHIILSGHVPELPAIVQSIGIGPHFTDIISSAMTGYEKPHPEMFKIALQVGGWPERVWMVGDNYEADVLGAEKAGIKGFLVRRSNAKATRFSKDLRGAIDIIAQNQ